MVLERSRYFLQLCCDARLENSSLNIAASSLNKNDVLESC